MHYVDPYSYANPLLHLSVRRIIAGSYLYGNRLCYVSFNEKRNVNLWGGYRYPYSVIRLWGAYPEGMSVRYSYNDAVTPLINSYIKPKHFGRKINMAKLKSTLPNMLLSLTLSVLTAGALLAGVNMYTEGPIKAAKAAALQKAIEEVTPPFDNDPLQDSYFAPTSDGDSLLIYPATLERKTCRGCCRKQY